MKIILFFLKKVSAISNLMTVISIRVTYILILVTNEKIIGLIHELVSWHLIWIYIHIKIKIFLLHMLFNDMVNLNLSITYSGDISAYLLFCIFSTDFTFIIALIKVLSLTGYPSSSPHKFDNILKLTWKYVFLRKGVVEH